MSNLHLDTFEEMMLITQDGQTFLSEKALELFTDALKAGWSFDDNYVSGNKCYVVLTMPYSPDHEAMYAQHKDALTMQSWCNEYLEKWLKHIS